MGGVGGDKCSVKVGLATLTYIQYMDSHFASLCDLRWQHVLYSAGFLYAQLLPPM